MAEVDEFSEQQIAEIFSNGAVGIDLGTTYSAVAAITEAGRVEFNECRRCFDHAVHRAFGRERGDDCGGAGPAAGPRPAYSRGRVCQTFHGRSDRSRAVGHPRQVVFTGGDRRAIVLGRLVKDASERLGEK